MNWSLAEIKEMIKDSDKEMELVQRKKSRLINFKERIESWGA